MQIVNLRDECDGCLSFFISLDTLQYFTVLYVICLMDNSGDKKYEK